MPIWFVDEKIWLDRNITRRKTLIHSKFEWLLCFSPAKHQYDIGTVEFTLVNSNWFLEQHIYDLLLLWMKDTISSVKTLLALLGSISISRGSYVRLIVGGGPFTGTHESISLWRRSENIFQIRTNQENININGDKIKSLYSSMQWA